MGTVLISEMLGINSTQDIKVARWAALAIASAMLSIVVGTWLWGQWVHNPKRLGRGLVIYDHNKLLSNRTRYDLEAKLSGLQADRGVVITAAVFRKKGDFEKLNIETKLDQPGASEFRIILIRDGGEILLFSGAEVKLAKAPEVVGEATLALGAGDPDFALYKQLGASLTELGLSKRVNIWE